MTAAMYPPESHALRDLPFEMAAVSAEHSRAWVSLDAGLAPGGVVSVGALTTVADVVAGALCGRAIAPDWMATSALSMHLGHLPQSGTLVVDARVARLGRTALVIQLALSPEGCQDSDGAGAAGEGVAAFSRLPRRDTTLDIAAYEPDPDERFSMALPSSGLHGSFESAIGAVVVDAEAGLTLTPVAAYVQNSFGAVNGGIVAALADIAARSVVNARYPAVSDGPAARTTDLSVQYLRQVRTGSVRTAAHVIRADHGTATLRVELSDAALAGEEAAVSGAPSRTAGATETGDGPWSGLMAVAHVSVRFGADG